MKNRFFTKILVLLIGMLGISQVANCQVWASNVPKLDSKELTNSSDSRYLELVSVSAQYESLKEVLQTLEQKTEVSFVYKEGLVNKYTSVSVDMTNQPITSVLDKLFENTSLEYSFADNYVIIKESQNRAAIANEIIKGQIFDEETNEALPGVNIGIKGTLFGGTTDMDGNYEIEVPSLQDTLVVSYVGYATQEVAIGGRTIINIALVPAAFIGEEVVVTGYGTQKKSLVTGSIASVSAEDLENTTFTRAEQALQGKTAGVQVVPTSGAPGAGMKVRIRGFATNGNSEPLYIVDGVKTGDINYLDPSEVSNIEVLKDAASSAIYGSEGANGVVIITTKKGRPGRNTITYDMQLGVQSVGHMPELMNAADYTTFMGEAGTTIEGNGVDTDWLDEVTETAAMQKHNISFSGGNNDSQFLLAGSFTNQDGIIVGDRDKFERYTLRFNADHKINDYIKVGNAISYAHFKSRTINEDSEYGSVIGSALMIDPTTPVSYTGALPSHVQAMLAENRKLLQNGNGDYYGVSRYVGGEIVNPYVLQAINKGESTNDKLLGNVNVQINPIEDLQITSRLGIELAYLNNHSWNPEYYYTSERSNTQTSTSSGFDRWSKWMWENFATYTKTFDEHNLTLLAGVSAEDFKHRWAGGSGGPLTRAADNYGELDYIVAQEFSTVWGAMTQTKKASYFGRLNYEYKGTYMFQATFRRDGASSDLLPGGGRWGFFPSFSAGWVLSNEDFFPESSFITHMKLRASWGRNGSVANLGNYPYEAMISSRFIYPRADGSLAIGSEPSRLSNPDLTWETSEQTDLGLDIRALDDRLLFSFDYYVKTTKDLLTGNTPPMETGNYAASINAGDVENKGMEFEVNYSNFSRDFTYKIGANIATLNNKVTYLNPTLDRLPGVNVGPGWVATQFEEGKPVWYFRGYETDGIDPATGDVIYVDQNEDGQISSDDLTQIGSAIPDLIFGANINLGYKNFDMNIFMQGTAGNDVLVGWYRTDRGTINRLQEFFDDRWTPSNTNARLPRAGVDSRAYTSDLMIYDGSYLRFKQIQLGYTLPVDLVNRIGVRKARIHVSLDDFFTITSYPGFNPEAGSGNNASLGIDRGVYPLPRKMMAGISLSF